jgi:hypothetical protein
LGQYDQPELPMLEDSGIPQLNLDARMEKLAWEARARLTWGEKPDDVKTWLLQAGADEEISQKVLEICLRERARSLRGKGLRDLLIATLLIGVSAAVAFVAAPALVDLVGGMPLKALLYVWVGCFFAGMYGVHFAWRGGTRLLLGARTKGADSDVGDIW